MPFEDKPQLCDSLSVGAEVDRGTETAGALQPAREAACANSTGSHPRSGRRALPKGGWRMGGPFSEAGSTASSPPSPRFQVAQGPCVRQQGQPVGSQS